MNTARRVGWMGLGVGMAVLIVGLALTAAATVAAGDWWAAREPWIGVGLNLSLIGLAIVGAFTLWLDIVERLGWLRLLAILPALLAGVCWLMLLVFGIPTTGFGGPEHDPATIIYSLGPGSLLFVVVATLLMALPLVPALAARGRQQRA